jgi:hypothetical protein
MIVWVHVLLCFRRLVSKALQSHRSKTATLEAESRQQSIIGGHPLTI